MHFTLFNVLSFTLTPPGVFDLADPYGHPAGHIQISLRWKFPYVSRVSSGEVKFPPAEKTEPSKHTHQSQKNADVDKAPDTGYVPPEANKAQVRTLSRAICLFDPRV